MRQMYSACHEIMVATIWVPTGVKGASAALVIAHARTLPPAIFCHEWTKGLCRVIEYASQLPSRAATHLHCRFCTQHQRGKAWLGGRILRLCQAVIRLGQQFNIMFRRRKV